MRTPFRNVMIGLLGGATVVAGSWLLLAEPSLGRTRNGQRANAARAKTGPNVKSHYGGGGYSGVCAPGSFRPLSAPESFLKRSKFRCFESTGNPTGDNADLSSDAFLASEDGTVRNMTKDTRRCIDGPNSGMTCAGYGSCPQGSCQDTTVLACTGDSHGHSMFFIFDGNPTGKNADLGDELFSFDTKTGQLTQLTMQRGWCSDDPTRPCDKSSDCANGRCIRARMIGRTASGYGSSPKPGLEVSPDGSVVWFVTDGDPGGNPTHAVTQFALTTRGSSPGLQAIGSSGKFCNSRTKHPGMPCAADIDCGPVCGDRRLDPGEECEPGVPPTCPTGEFCEPTYFPDPCTCATPVCGNGRIEPGEVCETTFGCPFPLHCNATCTACLSSPSGAFLDPMR
jgi:hypothetical protein